jgi:hypothetical protein
MPLEKRAFVEGPIDGGHLVPYLLLETRSTCLRLATTVPDRHHPVPDSTWRCEVRPKQEYDTCMSRDTGCIFQFVMFEKSREKEKVFHF